MFIHPGDSRDFSSGSRTSVTLRIETNPAKNRGQPVVGMPEVSIGSTTNLMTGETRTSTGPRFPVVGAVQDSAGNVVVNISQDMRSPFQPFGRGIRSDLDFIVNQEATSVEVMGTISGSPAFELNVAVDSETACGLLPATEHAAAGRIGFLPFLLLQSAPNERGSHGGGTALRTALILAELCTGLLWGLVAYEMTVSLLGVGEPIWDTRSFVYLGAVFFGPLLVVVGALLGLTRMADRTAAGLIVAGAVVQLAWCLYLWASLPAERDTGTLNATVVVVAIVALGVAIASFVAGLNLYAMSRGPRGST